MSAKRTALYVGLGVVGAVGIGAAVALAKKSSSPCKCAAPDVCPDSNGDCPSGYSVDSSNPDCCAPTCAVPCWDNTVCCPPHDACPASTGECPEGYTVDYVHAGCCLPVGPANLRLTVNGGTTPLTVPYNESLTISVSGGTPGDVVATWIGFTPGCVGPACNASQDHVGTFNASGNWSYSAVEFVYLDVGETFYITAVDTDTGETSNTIELLVVDVSSPSSPPPTTTTTPSSTSTTKSLSISITPTSLTSAGGIITVSGTSTGLDGATVSLYRGSINEDTTALIADDGTFSISYDVPPNTTKSSTQTWNYHVEADSTKSNTVPVTVAPP